MGIRGLNQFLAILDLAQTTSCEGREGSVPLSHIQTLVIDGNGFAMHIAECLYTEGITRNDGAYNYEDFTHRIGEVVDSLLELNIKLDFYFDGHKSKCKSHTKDIRRKKRDNECGKVIAAACGGQSYDTFMAPVLVVPQLKYLLKEYDTESGVTVVECTHEADQPIAIAVAQYNQQAGSEVAVVYGNDTDFITMKACPYVKFTDLILPTNCGEGGNNTTQQSQIMLYASKVYRRHETAKLLHLTENSFVELCLLIGNDFTIVAKSRKEYDNFMPIGADNLTNIPLLNLQYDVDDTLNDEDAGGQLDSNGELFDDNDDNDDDNGMVELSLELGRVGVSSNKKFQLPLKYTIQALQDLVNMVIRAEIQLALTPIDGISLLRVSSKNNQKLQLAIEYSRSFYNLDNLDNFPDDSSHSHGTESGDTTRDVLAAAAGTKSAYSLTTEEVLHVKKWIDTNDHSQLARGIVGNDMYLYLVTASRKDKIYKGNSNSSITLKDKHIEAFRILRELYSEEVDESNNPIYDEDTGEVIYKNNGYGDYEIGSCTSELDWSDIHAGWFLERLYLLFYDNVCTVPEYTRKAFFNYTYTNSYKNSPLMTYNGYLFHSILKQLDHEKNDKKLKKMKNGQKNAKGNMNKGSKSKGNPNDSESDEEVFDDFFENGPQHDRNKSSDGKERLPIDSHRERILESIARDRVTIIHGETGCGKSSRLPQFLVDEADHNNTKVKMFVSQPRRIAASSLMRRLRTSMSPDRIALRLGHGVRDGNVNADITFVTTGYLVRLMAHHPDSFKNHTHLIIDEVHERSVDGDLICYFARDLLLKYSHLKVILMSATADTDLYQSYFTNYGISKGQDFGELNCLTVGARRFPVSISYLDDIIKDNKISPDGKNAARGLMNLCSRNSDISSELVKQQYFVALSLIQCLGVPGTGILVFVSGIADIVEMLERLDGADKFIPIGLHGDLPDDEQIAAFAPVPSDKVKVIIATNIAESSLTIPDVDMVLCMGSHKSMQYHPKTHRANLMMHWISQASAVQRAGRTGRVRPGKVYRLYSQSTYHKFKSHDECEVLSKPLQDTILTLRAMLQDSDGFNGCIPILSDLLEPPLMDNINKSFTVLHASSMITQPSDSGTLTAAGYVASQLPVDLDLSRLVLYGILLGVGAEAAIVASALSQPKTVFKQNTRFFCHNPDKLHDLAGQGLLGSLDLDAGMYSGPLSMLSLYIQYKSKVFLNNHNTSKRGGYHSNNNAERDWMEAHCLVKTRVTQFVANADFMIASVNTALKAQSQLYTSGTKSKDKSYNAKASLSSSPRSKEELDAAAAKATQLDSKHLYILSGNAADIRGGMPGNSCKAPILTESVLNRLRLILVWSGDSNILRSTPIKCKSRHQITQIDLSLQNWVQPLHVRNMFPIQRNVPYQFNNQVTTVSLGKLSAKRQQSDVLTHLKELVMAIKDDGGVSAWISKKSLASGDKGAVGESAKVEYIALAMDQKAVPTAVKKSILTATEKSIERMPVRILVEKNNKHFCEIGNPVDIEKIYTTKVQSDRETVEKLSSDAKDTDAAASDAIEDQYRIWNIFVIKNPSKNHIKFFKELHRYLPVSIDLNVNPMQQPSILTVNNLTLPSDIIQDIFWDGNCDDIPKKHQHINTNVLGNVRKVIEFPDPISTKNEKDKQNESDGINVSVDPEPLILDLPLGMRIIMALKNKYKGNTGIRVWKDPPADLEAVNKHNSSRYNRSRYYPLPDLNANKNNGSRGIKEAPVGSAEYIAQKAAESLTNNDRNNEDMDRGWDTKMEMLKIDLPINGLRPGWKNLRNMSYYATAGLAHGEPDVMAIISGDTPAGVALHCGPHNLFAIGHNMTDIKIGSDYSKSCVIAGNATICPPGSRWISLAVSIAGYSCRELKSDIEMQTLLLFKSKLGHGGKDMSHRHNNGENEFDINEYLNGLPNKTEKLLCEYLCREFDAIFMRGNKNFAEQENLIALIDYLFSHWVSNANDMSAMNPVDDNDNFASQSLDYDVPLIVKQDRQRQRLEQQNSQQRAPNHYSHVSTYGGAPNRFNANDLQNAEYMHQLNIIQSRAAAQINSSGDGDWVYLDAPPRGQTTASVDTSAFGGADVLTATLPIITDEVSDEVKAALQLSQTLYAKSIQSRNEAIKVNQELIASKRVDDDGSKTATAKLLSKAIDKKGKKGKQTKESVIPAFTVDEEEDNLALSGESFDSDADDESVDCYVLDKTEIKERDSIGAITHAKKGGQKKPPSKRDKKAGREAMSVLSNSPVVPSVADAANVEKEKPNDRKKKAKKPPQKKGNPSNNMPAHFAYDDAPTDSGINEITTDNTTSKKKNTNKDRAADRLLDNFEDRFDC